jgi:hypothetical protein
MKTFHDGRRLGYLFTVYSVDRRKTPIPDILAQMRAWCRAFTRGYRVSRHRGLVRVGFVRPHDEIAFKLRWSTDFSPLPIDPWASSTFFPYIPQAGFTRGQLNVFAAGRQQGKSMLTWEALQALQRRGSRTLRPSYGSVRQTA